MRSKLFCGLDGTFFLGDRLLPGGLELLELLNRRGLPFSFSDKQHLTQQIGLHPKVKSFGVSEEDARVFTAGDATFPI